MITPRDRAVLGVFDDLVAGGAPAEHAAIVARRARQALESDPHLRELPIHAIRDSAGVHHIVSGSAPKTGELLFTINLRARLRHAGAARAAELAVDARLDDAGTEI